MTVIYQVGSPDGKRQMAIGRDDAELARFGASGLLDQIRGVMLQGSIQGAAYGLMRRRVR